MSKDRNKRLYKKGFINEKTLEELDEELAGKIRKRRIKKLQKLHEMNVELRFLRLGVTVPE